MIFNRLDKEITQKKIQEEIDEHFTSIDFQWNWKLTFGLQAKTNLQDERFNRTVTWKAQWRANGYLYQSQLISLKKWRANGYLYYLKPNRLSKMLTRVLIFIVESRSVEQHVIGTLRGITVLQSCWSSQRLKRSEPLARFTEVLRL